jgi:Fe-S-cluster containining protein
MGQTVTPAPTRIRLTLAGEDRDLPVDAPAGPASLRDLLPAARAVSAATTADAIARVVAEGKSISCRAGCGACCSQLVALAPVEVLDVADVVDRLPPDRQAVVRGRFADAVRRLEKAGLLDPNEPRGRRVPLVPAAADPDTVAHNLSARYFKLGIPCPFLDDGSCSIHPDRPLVCREYHVTTPAANCARVHEAEVDRVLPDVRMGPAVMAAGHRLAGLPHGQIPLTLALEWADTFRPAADARWDGTELAAALAAVVQDQADRVARGEDPSSLPEATTPPPPPPEATATIEIGIRSRRVKLQVTVPTGPATPRQVLPFARSLANAAVAVADEDTTAAGRPVSCRKGCGACCRQQVPVTETEARVPAELVERMPEPRRAAVTGRFADAVRRLDEAGLLAALRGRTVWADGERQAVGREYFEFGIPCPFLEDESCSIHPDRPLVCRGYLVTSPSEHCATPFEGKVERIELPIASPFRTFARAAAGLEPGAPIPWVPLVLALEWAAANPEPAPTKAGPELLRDVFRHMTGAAAPPPNGGADHAG